MEWRDDLKMILRRSAEGEQPVTFLFTDMQIKTESFLEDINNLLNAGEVSLYIQLQPMKTKPFKKMSKCFLVCSL